MCVAPPFPGNFPWLDPVLARFIKPSWSYSVLYSTLLSLVRARRSDKEKGKVRVPESEAFKVASLEGWPHSGGGEGFILLYFSEHKYFHTNWHLQMRNIMGCQITERELTKFFHA